MEIENNVIPDILSNNYDKNINDFSSNRKLIILNQSDMENNITN
jgi:hypothetical protein